MTPFEMDQNAFEIIEAPIIHSNPLADWEVRPRLVRQSRAKRLADRLEFPLFHRNRTSAVPQDLLHARSHQKRPTILIIKSAEQITWKQRLLNFLYPVRPATHTF